AARCSTIKGCTCLRRTKVSSRANDLSMLLSLSAAALKEPLSSIRTATTTALNRLFGFLTYRAFNRHSNTGLCQVTDRTRKRSVIKHLHRCSVVRVSRRHRLILYRTNHHRELSLISPVAPESIVDRTSIEILLEIDSDSTVLHAVRIRLAAHAVSLY